MRRLENSEIGAVHIAARIKYDFRHPSEPLEIVNNRREDFSTLSLSLRFPVTQIFPATYDDDDDTRFYIAGRRFITTRSSARGAVNTYKTPFSRERA